MDFLGGNSSFSATTQYITGSVKGENPSLTATILVLVSLGAAFTIYSAIDLTRLDGKVEKDPGLLRSLWIFCYSCFLKRHEGNDDGSQQGALESFYKSQAKIYDTTRRVLLKGRADMLSLAAAQLKHRANLTTGTEPQKQIWIDIGGGTGWNVEEMMRFVDVPNFFKHIYLVDLSPSLCEIARERFARLEWENVTVVCDDARLFSLEDFATPATKPSRATLITMSYSLSMIPSFHPVVDALQRRLLASDGVIGVVDFYAQSSIDFADRTYAGGSLNRHVSFLSRVFWRTWFEFDRVHLEPARRDYLEYCFGTIINVSSRNRTLGYVPYYIWLGSQKSSASLDAATGHALEVGEKNISAGVPLPSSFYQNLAWRKYYDDRLKKHTQFHDEYIYAFTWEDSAMDHSILALSPEDEVLAITSAGDNILSYLRASPAKVHAVDLNPSQNHLLELKVAAYCSLPYEDFWKIFGEGKHIEFRSLLLSTLSPYLSSRALQFWFTKCDTFEKASGGLYDSGGSRHGIRLFHRVAGLFGFRRAIQDILREGQTLANQNETWQKRIRPYLLSSLLSDLIISQPRFLWTALGVPENQFAMMEKDHADFEAVGTYFSEHTRSHTIWEYMANTLDPVLKHDLIATQNPYYYVCLARRFSRACHPDYLAPETHAQLAAPEAFRGLQIHTDEVQVVLASLPAASLTVAVLMDSMDWFAPGSAEAKAQVERLSRALKLGGRVLIRSAGLRPWYLDLFSCLGFRAVCEGAREKGAWIDRVNMYASCWVMTKVSELWGFVKDGIG